MSNSYSPQRGDRCYNSYNKNPAPRRQCKVKDIIRVNTSVIIIHLVTVGILSFNEVTEDRTEAITNMTKIPSVTITINTTASHTMGIGRTLNHPKEPSLSNLSSFVTQDGVRFEARNNQVFSKCLHRRVTVPTTLAPGMKYMHSMGNISDSSSDSLIHQEYVQHIYAFTNTNTLDTVYNAKHLSWQCIHNAITTGKNRELFETDLIVQGIYSVDESTRITIQVNKNCLTELLLLDNTKVLSLHDSGSTETLFQSQ